MKKTKLIAIAVLFVAAFSFTSCKKCVECTVTYQGVSDTDKECYESNKAMKAEKKEIEQDCEELQQQDPDFKCSCKAA